MDTRLRDTLIAEGITEVLGLLVSGADNFSTLPRLSVHSLQTMIHIGMTYKVSKYLMPNYNQRWVKNTLIFWAAGVVTNVLTSPLYLAVHPELRHQMLDASQRLYE